MPVVGRGRGTAPSTLPESSGDKGERYTLHSLPQELIYKIYACLGDPDDDDPEGNISDRLYVQAAREESPPAHPAPTPTLRPSEAARAFVPARAAMRWRLSG